MPDELNTQQPTAPAVADPPPAAPVSEPVAPSVSADLLERASKVGLDFGEVGSDRDFALKLFEAFEADRPFAQHGRQALVNPPAQPVAEPKPEAPSEDAFDLDKHFAEAWKLPELSPGAQWALQHGAFTTNEQGVIVAASGLEQIALPYLREIQEHTQARETLTEEFQKNPVRFMWDKLYPAMEHKLRNEFQELDTETRSRSEAEAFEKKFADENKSWLYGADGNLSPAGVKFQQAVQELQAGGMRDPQKLAHFAALAAKPATQPETQPTEPSGDGQPRGPDGKFASKQSSFLENAKRQSAASGSRNAHDPEDYKPANRGELGNIWNEALQRHMAGKA